MERKKILTLAIGIVLGVVAIFIINTRLQERENLIKGMIAQGRITEVVVAKQDIRKNTAIKANMIALAKVPAKDAQKGVIRSADSIMGKIANIDILRKQIIYSTMLRFREDAQTLSQKTPPGKMAYTISIDKISAVGGQIRAGDRINVIGIMRIPQMQNGKVVQQEIILTLFESARVLAAGASGKTLNSITLALTPEEIKVLTFVLENGKVKLVLRSPLDTTSEAIFKPFTFDTFMQKIYKAVGMMPQAPGAGQPKASQPVKKKVEKKIEIYRGGQ